MIRRIFVTICSILLLTGAVQPPANPHVIQITAMYEMPLPNPHILIGIAVLGHNVGRIDRGWLIKHKGGGYFHIDWTRGGDWTGLTRTEEGPRDVSQAQLDAVIGGVEKLGVPATAIRSWRVAAPVGYDGFQEGDKVLTIGEILIDLGTPEQANAMLPKLDSAVVSGDALDHFPRTNVAPIGTFFYQLDCGAMRDELAKKARIDTGRVLSTIAKSTHAAASFLRTDIHLPYDILCSNDARPNFYNADVSFPYSISRDTMTRLQGVQVYYTIAGHSSDARLVADPGDLEERESAAAPDLSEPYVATVAKSELPIVPDWYLFHVHYLIANRRFAEHDHDVAMSKSKIAYFTQLIHAPNELLVKTGVNPQLAPETPDVYIRVRSSDRATIEAIVKNYRVSQFGNDITVSTYLKDCEPAKRQVLLQALDHARKKADVLASVLHAQVGELGAAHADTIGDFGTICGIGPNASLATLIDAAPPNAHGAALVDPAPSFSTTVTTAWLLAGRRPSTTPLKSYTYQSTVRADAPSFALELKVLRQTALEAIVDNQHITSMYEYEPSMESYNGTTASDTLVVLR